jgi:hypothetical protein
VTRALEAHAHDMLAHAGYVSVTFNKDVRERIKSKARKVGRNRRAIDHMILNDS